MPIEIGPIFFAVENNIKRYIFGKVIFSRLHIKSIRVRHLLVFEKIGPKVAISYAFTVDGVALYWIIFADFFVSLKAMHFWKLWTRFSQKL